MYPQHMFSWSNQKKNIMLIQLLPGDMMLGIHLHRSTQADLGLGLERNVKSYSQ